MTVHSTRADSWCSIVGSKFQMLGCMRLSTLMRLGPARARDKFRLLLWAIQRPITVGAWLLELHCICESTIGKAIPFDLARKPTRRFLHNGLLSGQRLILLSSHYRTLRNTLSNACVHDLITGREAVLSGFVGRGCGLYELRLRRSPPEREREGELTVRLLRFEDQATIATVTFAVAAGEPDGPLCLWVGGLQGCARELGSRVTVQVTKDLFGLRPKDLLMHSVYVLKRSFGASKIRAVTNYGHASTKNGRPRQWLADYDLYWAELGGAADGLYTYDLPSHPRRRSIHEVPSSKRCAWRARHALIDRIAADIAAFCAQHQATRIAVGSR